jgi:hypothetical protein
MDMLENPDSPKLIFWSGTQTASRVGGAALLIGEGSYEAPDSDHGLELNR